MQDIDSIRLSRNRILFDLFVYCLLLNPRAMIDSEERCEIKMRTFREAIR
jgi:hypothetical protein